MRNNTRGSQTLTWLTVYIVK